MRGVRTLVLVLLAVAAGLGCQAKEDLPVAELQVRATAHLTNDVFDLYFNEQNSDVWWFEYAPGETGESCYHEHFAVWTPASGIQESENFVITAPFGAPAEGRVSATLQAGAFEITRSILVESGSVNFFTITYTIRNAAGAAERDVRFFQTIDFDIPFTSDCTDDYGRYNAASHAVSVTDYEFFRNTVTSVPVASQYGVDYWSTEINEDWDDGQLNGQSFFGPGDPGVGLQFNLGDLAPGAQRTVVIKITCDVATGAADLTIQKVEINQAFQDRDVEDVDAVPLVADKPAVVRAFVGIGPVEGPVSLVSGELHVLKDGVEVSGSPFAWAPGTISAPKTPSRQRVGDTLNFYLGELPAGDYQGYLVVDPANEVFESDESNNRYPTGSGYFTFGMTAQEPVRLLFYRLEQDGTYASWDIARRSTAWTEKTYPTGDVQFVDQGDLTQFLGQGDFSCNKLTQTAVTISIAERLALYNLLNSPDAHAAVVWLPDASAEPYDPDTCPSGGWLGMTMVLGVVNWPIPVTYIYDNWWNYQSTMAHELGHTYGLNLVLEEYDDPSAEPIGSGGFDVLGQTAVSDEAWNFMNDETTADSWVSRETYTELFGDLADRGRAGECAVAEYIIVSGMISVDGNAYFNPFYMLTADACAVSPSGGTYTLRFLDGSRAVLAEYGFTPDFRAYGIEAEADVAPFLFVLPFPYSTKYVTLIGEALVEARDALAEVVVSAHAPSVEVRYPNGGENFSGVVDIAWVGADQDGDELTYAVLYSPDGSAWLPIAEGLGSTTFAWDTGSSPGGPTCYIKVMATDGVNTSQDESDGAFSVQRKAPHVSVLSPSDGYTSNLGQVVALNGVGYDLEDGQLTEQALTWRSSIGGLLGSGEALYISSLSLGQHTITLTGTDGQGAEGTDSITVDVIDDTTPPSPPVGLGWSQSGGIAALTWIANAVGDVAGYILHLGENAGVYGFIRDVGNVTEWRSSDFVVGRTYYAALQAYDQVGNQSELSDETAFTYASACEQSSFVTGAAGWHMVSLPGTLCDPCTWTDGLVCGDLVCALGDDIDPFYAFRYDADLRSYTRVPPADEVCYQLGMGMWIYTWDADTQIDSEVTALTGNVELALQNGWNQIGNPYAFAIGTGSIWVRCGAEELSLIEAQAEGWITALLYGYEAGAYVEIDPASGCLPAWTACWLRAYRADCTLVFQPVGCTSSLTQVKPLSEAEARALELPPPPPLNPQALDIKEVLAGLSATNIPNPIRSEHTTVFRVEGVKADIVEEMRVDIYDQSGQRVFMQAIAAKELAWHTVNDAGELLANGVYLYQVWVRIGEIWYPLEVQKLAVVR
jgi:hypothetical protein